MRAETTAGQTSVYLGFDMVMADNLPTPSVLLADRGYDADSIRKSMDERDVLPVIPLLSYDFCSSRCMMGAITLIAQIGVIAGEGS